MARNNPDTIRKIIILLLLVTSFYIARLSQNIPHQLFLLLILINIALYLNSAKSLLYNFIPVPISMFRVSNSMQGHIQTSRLSRQYVLAMFVIVSILSATKLGWPFSFGGILFSTPSLTLFTVGLVYCLLLNITPTATIGFIALMFSFVPIIFLHGHIVQAETLSISLFLTLVFSVLQIGFIERVAAQQHA